MSRTVHEVPPFLYLFLLHVNTVRSRFRQPHVVHGLSYPLARRSLRLTVTLSGVVCNLLSHALHRITLGENSTGFTLRKMYVAAPWQLHRLHAKQLIIRK